MGAFALAVTAWKIAPVILQFLHIGGGCGETCIDAAKMEQVFEVAGDYIAWWGTEGYLTSAEAMTALNQIKTLGQQNLQSLGTPQAQNGIRNMEQAMSGNFQAASGAASSPSQAWDRNKALSDATPRLPSQAGFYQDAFAKGQALAVQIVEQGILPNRPVTSQLSAALGGVAGGQGNSKTLLYVAGGLLLAKKFLFTR